MRFGVCGNEKMALRAAAAGFDYLETTVGGLLKPKEDDAVFKEALALMRDTGLPCEVVNCLMPGRDLKITGPDVDPDALRSYLDITLSRAAAAAVQIAVFGSGGAREIPEGFDREAAHEQLLAFSSMAGAMAGAHGVTIVLEPLRKQDCNVLTTVAECARLVREVNHPNFRLLVDSYHFMADRDSYQSIIDNGDLFAHVHVATAENRRAPGGEPCDLSAYFNALTQGGYNARVSIEATIEPDEDLAPALALMKAYCHGTA
ncbi:MAG: sugar phosphate isomerase/epimerase family protein [Lentisphaeria bacterium]|nr:sugar phosphate isomerase/epimerase family protein [Lentisphaeria bacterium]